MDTVKKLNEPIEFAMEATGHYWFSLYAHLRQNNQTVIAINPLQSDSLRGLFIHETKTDNIDAFIIAEVVRIGRYTKTEILPENIHALRELCRQRFYVIDMVSDIKRKIIALLDQVFPEYAKLFTDTFGFILASSSFSLIIKQLKSFESCIDSFDAEIAKIDDTFDCKLHTITGIGKTLAAVIISEISDEFQRSIIQAWLFLSQACYLACFFCCRF